MFEIAASLALVIALLFLTGAAVAGYLIIPLAGGIVWLVFALGLKASQRWLAYIAFLAAAAGAVAVYATTSSSGFPQWLNASIIAVNVLLFLVLFIIIWRAPPKKPA